MNTSDNTKLHLLNWLSTPPDTIAVRTRFDVDEDGIAEDVVIVVNTRTKEIISVDYAECVLTVAMMEAMGK